jgi:STAM-binding protein
MQREMAASRQRLDGAREGLSDPRRHVIKPVRPVPERNEGSDYRYPTIPKSQPSHYENSTPTPGSDTLPPKPPKHRIEADTNQSYSIAPPSLPAKTALDGQADSVAEEITPNAFTFRPSAYLENGKPLRTVFLPTSLRDKFLAYALPNTRKNLETCGVLCGTLISNALFISRVVIPEQTSTSDTCETVNEVALFEYCSQEDLMVLGWIHTHPTQTCFMSSRDLHTHFGYQTMISESIAIVCAPSKSPS